MMRYIVAALVLTPAMAVAAEPVAKIGALAPNFEIALVDGTKIPLAALRGKVVVLNFWATWCVPCRKELPLLDAYYRINEKHGLRVFAVTTEGSVPLYQLKKLFAAIAIPAARRIKGGYAPVNGAVPTNFVIDREGRLRYASAGAFDLDALNTTLVPLLREAEPAR